MILYVNGDSHSVGHGITSDNFGMANKDPVYQCIGEAPHPKSFPFSYGAKLSKLLKADLVCQGQSGGSWDRVIRLTKQFVYQSQGDIFVLLGLPDSRREEWFYRNAYYNISGVDESIRKKLPVELHDRYKKYALENDEGIWYRRSVYMHNSATELHNWLNYHNIPHLFFNYTQCFDMAIEQLPKVTDFGVNFVYPYDPQYMYEVWCKNKGFIPDAAYHFGADAHEAWANFLLPYVKEVLK